MVQDLLVREQGQAEGWDVVGGRVEEGWEETVLEQARVGTVFAPVVGRGLPIKLASLAIT